MTRQSNRPTRRVALAGTIAPEALRALVGSLRYVGSGLHKLHPGDYGFVPSHNPRPCKSPCDELRPVLRDEAVKLFLQGVKRGMVSAFAAGSVPKYVWAVDEHGEVYEAKIGSAADYHGYRLGEDEQEMRRYILREWQDRCPLD
jgi:hypothetical protein